MSARRSRILGKMMSQYIGKNVVIAGNLTKVTPNGDCVELTTFDNIRINVTVPTPLQGNPEGILEVWGVVKSKGTIEAVQYTHFDAEGSQDFDEKAYNDLIIIQHAIQGKKWKLDEHRRAL